MHARKCCVDTHRVSQSSDHWSKLVHVSMEVNVTYKVFVCGHPTNGTEGAPANWLSLKQFFFFLETGGI